MLLVWHLIISHRVFFRRDRLFLRRRSVLLIKSINISVRVSCHMVPSPTEQQSRLGGTTRRPSSTWEQRCHVVQLIYRIWNREVLRGARAEETLVWSSAAARSLTLISTSTSEFIRYKQFKTEQNVLRNRKNNRNLRFSSDIKTTFIKVFNLFNTIHENQKKTTQK